VHEQPLGQSPSLTHFLTQRPWQTPLQVSGMTHTRSLEQLPDSGAELYLFSHGWPSPAPPPHAWKRTANSNPARESVAAMNGDDA
jgi:hypothetical protein